MNLSFEELLPVLEEAVVFDTNTIAASINDPTKAPGRFPYPMDNILDDFADAYLHLRNIRSLLDAGSQNRSLTDIERQSLKKLRDKINILTKSVKKVAGEIETNFAR
jgi:hypothetical protein